MNSPEHPVIARDALRRLAEEARQRAAVLDPSSAEHDFYSGVQKAAADLAGPVAETAGWSALRDRSPAFRDGYLKVSNMAGAMAGHPPTRYPLPTPDRPRSG